MTILHPDPIIKKLESDGKAVVRKKLEQGVYAEYKLPLIKKWLKSEPVETTPEEKVESIEANPGGEEESVIELVDQVPEPTEKVPDPMAEFVGGKKAEDPDTPDKEDDKKDVKEEVETEPKLPETEEEVDVKKDVKKATGKGKK